MEQIIGGGKYFMLKIMGYVVQQARIDFSASK